MKKKKQYPTLEEFKVRFPRVLKSHYSRNQTIDKILQNEKSLRLCVALLWHCVNDCEQRLDRIAGDFRKKMKTELDAALRGIEALSWIYTEVDPKPHLLESLSLVKSDVALKHRLVESAPPPLDHGMWALVTYVRNELKKDQGAHISHGTLSDLLNAAFAAAGLSQKISEDGVRHGLKRFAERHRQQQALSRTA